MRRRRMVMAVTRVGGSNADEGGVKDETEEEDEHSGAGLKQKYTCSTLNKQ